ncbi:zinc-binding protein A33-like [Rhincodon typus]|uniref:zinc-binding protein A33-like n=1 Tax=Rhincodon typus TaxID=259920 RepID=UPI002030C1B4|nr:zinc-binding protein A33-like [Rhincodon typus]
MSSWVLAEGLTSEVTCPICLNLYQDPVRLECEHNFCRACIADAWGELESGFSCPQCQETFPQLRLKSNRLLANIVERVRQLRLDAAPIPSADSGPALCPLHEEKLKLYCQDDQQAICVVCGVSKEHKGHRIVPIHETMQYCQEKLTESSGELEKRVEAISRIEASQEKAVLELKDKTETIKNRIASEFDALHNFLQEEQDVVLGRLREEEHKLLQEMQENLKKLHAEKSTLETMLASIQQRLHEEDPVCLLQGLLFSSTVILLLDDTVKWYHFPSVFTWNFVQVLFREITQLVKADVKDLSERLKQDIASCEVVPARRLNIGSFQGPLQYAVWKKMRNRISPVPAPLTLDPRSANPYLVLSEDLTAAKYSYTSQQLPDNLERFDFCACVLASEGFESGKHYWEVDVGRQPDWDVGVAAESIDREGWVILTPENGFWTFGHVERSRIGVYLDHEEGQVSFYDAEDMAHLHTFVDTFSEKLFPFFYPSADTNTNPLKICHQVI